jgi:hypothetical protein
MSICELFLCRVHTYVCARVRACVCEICVCGYTCVRVYVCACVRLWYIHFRSASLAPVWVCVGVCGCVWVCGLSHYTCMGVPTMNAGEGSDT